MKRAVLVVVTSLTLGVGASPSAATEVVDNDRSQCPRATHTTIQQGVDAANPGEMVMVCAGVYREQVTVAGRLKQRVEIRGPAPGAGTATIQAPSGATGPIVRIDGAPNTTLRWLRIAGPFEGSPCPTRGVNNYGVLITGGARLVRLRTNQITDIRDGLNENCFFGRGIQVDDDSAAILESNRISGYEFAGIEVVGDRSSVTASFNQLSGAPVDSTQVAFWVREGAQANALSNAFRNSKTGVQTETTRPVTLRNNEITGNGIGIQLVLGGVTATANTITGNVDGVLAHGGSNILQRNDVRGNWGTDCNDTTAGLNPSRPGFFFYTTLNRWVRNKGEDADPAPLCTPSGNPGPSL